MYNSSVISANCASHAASQPKARTTSCPATISFTKPERRPCAALLAAKKPAVRFATKPANQMETGVTATTTKAIKGFSTAMMPSVPRMVATPGKSWVRPCSRPSATSSASFVMRLMMSPWGWLSK